MRNFALIPNVDITFNRILFNLPNCPISLNAKQSLHGFRKRALLYIYLDKEQEQRTTRQTTKPMLYIFGETEKGRISTGT